LFKSVWKGGTFEEKQIIGKAIGRIAKKYLKECLKIIPSFLSDLDNWTNCDNLASAMEPILLSNPDEVLSLCEKWVNDKNKWIRRFGVVTLKVYRKIPTTNRVVKILDYVMEDDDKDVRNAISLGFERDNKKEF
jgi:3-methyladenine DNA glycosylase AlkD